MVPTSCRSCRTAGAPVAAFLALLDGHAGRDERPALDDARAPARTVSTPRHTPVCSAVCILCVVVVYVCVCGGGGAWGDGVMRHMSVQQGPLHFGTRRALYSVYRDPAYQVLIGPRDPMLRAQFGTARPAAGVAGDGPHHRLEPHTLHGSFDVALTIPMTHHMSTCYYSSVSAP